MSSKCPRCGKTVYFAERQTAEGKDWHGICLMEAIKEKKQNAPKQ
jgi:ribosomal protein S27AE